MTLRSTFFILSSMLASVVFVAGVGLMVISAASEGAAKTRLRELMERSFLEVVAGAERNAQEAADAIQLGLASAKPVRQLLLAEAVVSNQLDFALLLDSELVVQSVQVAEPVRASKREYLDENMVDLLIQQIRQVPDSRVGVAFLGQEPVLLYLRELDTAAGSERLLMGYFVASLLEQLEAVYGFAALLDGDQRPVGAADSGEYIQARVQLPGLASRVLDVVVEDHVLRDRGRGGVLIACAVLALLLGVLLWLVVRAVLFGRLHAFITQAHHINQQQDYHGRIKLEGEDELTELAGHYNSMLSTLEYSYNLMAKSNLITTQLIGKVQQSTQYSGYGRRATDQSYDDDDDLKLSLDMVTRLSEAVEGHALEVYYQPVLDLTRDRVVDFELLLRWLDADLGMVAPADFIALAEKSGQMMALARTGLEQAGKDLAVLSHAMDGHFSISVNLSQSQFYDEELLPLLQSVLQSASVKANALELEIKEHALARDIDQSLQIISAIRELGVKVCIDDFGLSKYSLMYLQRLPVNRIKLTRAYLDRLETSPKEAAFIDGIARFAAGLGMRVVAKGIENEKQLYALSNTNGLDCQGYALARPMPLETLQEWLRSRSQTGENE